MDVLNFSFPILRMLAILKPLHSPPSSKLSRAEIINIKYCKSEVKRRMFTNDSVVRIFLKGNFTVETTKVDLKSGLLARYGVKIDRILVLILFTSFLQF